MTRLYLFAICFLSVLALRPGNSLAFRENKGQVSDQHYRPRPDVLYSANDSKITYHFKMNGFSYQLNKISSWEKTDKEILSPLLSKRRGDSAISEITFFRVDINWINSNAAGIENGVAEEGYDNYYLEVCPSGVLGVKSYKDITYKNLYKGIDVKWYEKNGSLKYDYIVSAGSDYRQIQFEIKGAEKIYLNKNGELVIKTPLGEITEQKPHVVQGHKILDSKWKIKNNIVSFEIKDVDQNQTIIIDPLVRLWGTYYGDNFQDEAWYATTDGAGNVFCSGNTTSLNNIATSGAHQTVYNGTGFSTNAVGDAFIAKFSSAGVRQWATYYGGSGSEIGQPSSLIGNDIVLLGNTTSTNAAIFATPGTYQQTYSGGTIDGDGFLVRFNTNGVRIWSTYFGGPGDEWNFGLNVNTNNEIIVGGYTSSISQLASPGAHQTTYAGGGRDAFLFKFDLSGNRIWSTYFGGTSSDLGWSCTSDAAGNIYLTGSTFSNGMATTGAHQTTFGGGGGNGDGFIAKFNAAGTRLWSTYYGGPGDDIMYNAVLDGNGNVYIAGHCGNAPAGVIATANAHQSTYGGGLHDCFLVKFDPSGTRIWGTHYGGPGDDEYGFCAIDNNGNIYIAGNTTTPSGTNIATPCTYQEVSGGMGDAFLAKFTGNGVRFWGTFYGGTGTELWPTTCTDIFGRVYLVGETKSTTAITTSTSHQPVYGGGLWDGFLVKFDGCLNSVLPNTTPPPDMNICIGENTSLTTSFNACGIQWMDSPNGNVIGTNSVLITPTLNINTTYYVQDISCGPGGTLTAIEVTVNPLPVISILGSDSVLCSGQTASLTATGAGSYTWFPALGNSGTVNINPESNSTYTVYGFDGVCTNYAVATISTIPYPSVLLQYPQNDQCNNSEVNITVSGAQQFYWSPSSMLSSPTGSNVTTVPLSASASFSVTGINSLGTVSCSTQSSLTINVLQPLIVTISPSVEICEGSQTALYVSGGNTWQWYGPNISDPYYYGVMVTPLTSAVYSVEASYNYVCPVTSTVFVKVNPKPFLFAGNDTTINIGDYATIYAASNGEVKWITGDYITCRECAKSIVYPYTKTCYIAESISDKGCRTQDEICVDVINDYNIYIPNTFTPDGDGLNDIFSIHGYGIKEYSLLIYNRWGDLLFSTNSSHSWDGKFNGTVCEDGVYVYKADIMPIKGKLQQRTGHVTLLSGK